MQKHAEGARIWDELTDILNFSAASISNYIEQYSVACNYLTMA